MRRPPQASALRRPPQASALRVGLARRRAPRRGSASTSSSRYEVLAEEEFAIEAGLSPIKQVRLRKKSRDLEEEGTKLMSENLEKAFLAMDLNGDGKLDATELKAAFASAGRACTDSMIKIAIKNLDTDDDNEVSFEEFKAIAWHLAIHQNQ